MFSMATLITLSETCSLLFIDIISENTKVMDLNTEGVGRCSLIKNTLNVNDTIKSARIITMIVYLNNSLS